MSDTPKLNLVPVTAPSVSEAPIAQAAAKADQRTRSTGAQAPATPEEGAGGVGESSPGSSPWREWSSFDRTVSYRLPPELLAELEDRLWALRLPVGVTVAAALADLLDRPDEEILRLAARAEAAKPRRRPRSTS